MMMIMMMIMTTTCTVCSAVNWMRARYLMLQGQMDYAMMYLDRVSSYSRPKYIHTYIHTYFIAKLPLGGSSVIHEYI